METAFITTTDGSIWFDIPNVEKEDRVRFFCIQTVTRIKDGNLTQRVYTTRWMAAGLLSYMLSNKPFQDRILRENQSHAAAHFHLLPGV